VWGGQRPLVGSGPGAPGLLWEMDMKTLLGSTIVLAAIVLMAAPAHAQGKKGRGFGGAFGSPLNLLANKDVQKDMKITDDQASKIKELADMRPKFDKDDAQGFFAKLKEFNETAKEKLKGILSADQARRLEQLTVQQQGASALVFNKTVAEKLGLSDDQTSKIRELTKGAREKMKEIFQENQDDKDARQKKMAELQKSLLTDALKELTADQRIRWQELVGPAFQGTLPVAFGGGFGFGKGKKKDD
jgi:Spy/CpxP family protein refolding chaperone